MTSPPLALVTGASSGIGDAYARALAAQGYRVLALGRREERLIALQSSCAEGRLVPLVVDLENEDEVNGLLARLADEPPLKLLVNNAGFATAAPFVETELEAQLALCTLHNQVALRLCHAAIPRMETGAAIINISSLCVFGRLPQAAVYGATKSFLHHFSLSLAEELKERGIIVQSVCAGPVRTELHGTERLLAASGRSTPAGDEFPEAAWIDAEELVEESLGSLDLERPILLPGEAAKGMAQLALGHLLRSLRS